MYNDESNARAVWTALGVVLLLICIGYFLITYRTEKKVHVAGVSWMRAIDIQQWMTVQESDWDVPTEGRKIREYSAVHHYNHVYIGSTQTCSGTGIRRTCTSQANYIDEPVYHTKYDYWIERWVVEKTLVLQAEGHEAKWPDVTDLTTHTTLTIGDERPGTRTSRYTVAFTDGYNSLDITEERWRTYDAGQPVVLVLNIFQRAVDIKKE